MLCGVRKTQTEHYLFLKVQQFPSKGPHERKDTVINLFK